MTASSTPHFADRLLAAIEAKGTPLVVGLDPVYDLLPAVIRNDKNFNDPNDPQAASDAILEYSKTLLRVVAPHVAVVKINIAFFETYHWDGLEAYHAIVQEAAAHGLMVIGDVKRGDIGNTAVQYAAATLADPTFGSMEGQVSPDAVTISAYMGKDSVQPFLDIARPTGKGLFALVRTSNPGAADIQDVRLENGETMYMHVGKMVGQWGADAVGIADIRCLARWLAPTNAQQLVELRAALPQTLFLVPGLGAQGGTAQDAAHAFKADGTGAIINASRSIIYAYNDPRFKRLPGGWEKAVEASLLETKQNIAQALAR